MKYSIVIPTYNNCDKYFKYCIESIIKYTDLEDVEIIVSANGCTDNTVHYLLIKATEIENLKVVWNDEPIGFAKACNEGIKASIGEKIVLLNNDTLLLKQEQNEWLHRLDCGFDITSVLTNYSEITRNEFAVFFCVMIHRSVFDTIGLLPEDYPVGGCEDIDFCYQAVKHRLKIVNIGRKGDFPIYHKAEGTMHDEKLVHNWKDRFYRNELILAKKYNYEHYKYLLSNNYERAVFLKDDHVFPREKARYEWANQHILGKDILEIGCSTGYGRQFINDELYYTGLDIDPIIIEVATAQNWAKKTLFLKYDINEFHWNTYDTIIAFEVIEHIDNGLEIVEMLKLYCKRLIISVPHNEPKGFWGEHHKLHGLNESHFKGFKFSYMDEWGNITDEIKPVDGYNKFNLMLCRWDK